MPKGNEGAISVTNDLSLLIERLSGTGAKLFGRTLSEAASSDLE
jgi:hypothetical protein